MPLLHLIAEGLTQVPNLSSNLVSSFGLLLVAMVGPLPLIGEETIAIFLVLQLVWCLLLWVRSMRVVGSQSTRRTFEADARAAALTWMDVLRFAALGWVLKNVLFFEVGVQMCELYCGVIALRTLMRPFAYVVLRIYCGPVVASRFTGIDASMLFELMGAGRSASEASGPAWKQHGETGKKQTSAARRVSSLAPSVVGSDAKNNNGRCVVLSEGPHFNRTARGCLLDVGE
ncbi:hypothetical protein ABL78_5006 [Leptomonas seymouri]|uniref:Uncharacterized protein n=1 Tax=Leptomonas seymouri TaxID=5684 RepID=A0A0N1PCS2_LEPSE|nr:hypothetical protein ABL78_5006 [Leptomonas seymouri]|eukprot:KPI85922.1 hypothetical protein ABL78_5006 [Leptomonas seymouri]